MRVLTDHHEAKGAGAHAHGSGGAVLNGGWRYDAEVWLFDTFAMRGQLRRLRARVLDLAHDGPVTRLLDVGCGTGNLAIDAARDSGSGQRVAGIDPAPRQIARARRKARHAGVDVDFRTAQIQALPFDDASFDAVTSTLMLHHLPDDATVAGLAEIRRVLAAGGRLVIADFAPANEDTGPSQVPGQLLQAGFADTTVEHLAFPRAHQGWAGVTITCATRAPHVGGL